MTKMQPIDTILFFNPHIHIHPFINITLCVFLTKQIFEQLLTLLFFFLQLHTNINNTLNI